MSNCSVRKLHVCYFKWLGILLCMEACLLSSDVAAQAVAARAPQHTAAKAKRKARNPALVARELKLVDSMGHTRILLTTTGDQPAIRLLRSDGLVALQLVLAAGKNPSVQIKDPSGQGASATLEIDDKGTHLKLDHASGSSTYVFMNDEGVSGLVFENEHGQKRYEILDEPKAGVTVIKPLTQGQPQP